MQFGAASFNLFVRTIVCRLLRLVIIVVYASPISKIIQLQHLKNLNQWQQCGRSSALRACTLADVLYQLPRFMLVTMAQRWQYVRMISAIFIEFFCNGLNGRNNELWTDIAVALEQHTWCLARTLTTYGQRPCPIFGSNSKTTVTWPISMS